MQLLTAVVLWIIFSLPSSCIYLQGCLDKDDIVKIDGQNLDC